MFSIIVPVYNTEPYINECIDSIIRSTYNNWELLLINDGSTDLSGGICDMRSHEDQRIHVFHQKNRGVSAARNLGIENATGNWLVFVDSDDFIAPNMLERLSETIDANENTDLFFTDFFIIHSDNKEIFRTYPWSCDKEESFQNYLTRSWPRVAWGAVKKELVADNKIKYPENLTVFEDFHFMCRCILHAHNVKRIDEPLYNYRATNAQSITHTLTTKRKRSDEKWVYYDLFSVMKSMDNYTIYAPSIYWRMLHDKQALVLESSLHHEFVTYFPEKREYILSCASISLKMKLMMWCLTHHLANITKIMLAIRHKIKNYPFKSAKIKTTLMK